MEAGEEAAEAEGEEVVVGCGLLGRAADVEIEGGHVETARKREEETKRVEVTKFAS